MFHRGFIVIHCVPQRGRRRRRLAAAANFRLVSGDGIRAEADASSLQSIVPKPSVMTTTGNDEGEFNTISSNTFFADALANIRGAGVPQGADARGTMLEDLTVGEVCDILACRQSSAAVTSERRRKVAVGPFLLSWFSFSFLRYVVKFKFFRYVITNTTYPA